MAHPEKRKIALLSNVTADLIAAKLRRDYEIYLPEGFDTWVQESIAPGSGLYAFGAEAVIVLLDGTECRSWQNSEMAEERIGLWQQAVRALCRTIGDRPVFVSTLDIRENRIRAFSEPGFGPELEADWLRFLQSLMEEHANLCLLELADLITEYGRKTVYSDKMWYLSSMPYSRDGLNLVSQEIERGLRAAFTSRKKLIVLDLDNTLWGGVIGEDGLEGIELSDHKEGQRYYDFQRQLLEMRRRGVVLAIDSKNNEEDADSAIRKHPAMLLREEDFVARRINWENKATNLKSIARELNLTPGGILFVDDNPVERAVVAGECPEVTVPEFPEDSSLLLNFAEGLWREYFQPLRVLDEDRKKTQMYRSEAMRRQEESESLNLEDYIAKLHMRADIHRMRPEELERTAQLCGKTNQFNLTTKRYTQAEIAEMAASEDHRVYVVHAGDKYGDSGLISVVILAREEKNVRIDSFLMSCRVMGRNLENIIVGELAASLTGADKLIGEFRPTAKNAPVRELYDRLGFTLTEESEQGKRYELDLCGFEKPDTSLYENVQFEA